MLEKLARGTLTRGPTLISQNYAQGFYQMLKNKKCINKETENVIAEKLYKKLKKGQVDLEYLN